MQRLIAVSDDLHVHHVLHEVLGNAGHHRAEHVEAFPLPFGQRVLLAHRTEVDAALQVVHLFEMLAPALVDDPQHHLTLDLTQDVLTELGLTLFVVRCGVGHHDVIDLVGVSATTKLIFADRVRPVEGEFSGETVDVPLVVGDRCAVRW